MEVIFFRLCTRMPHRLQIAALSASLLLTAQSGIGDSL